jgi:hypothetical protein
VLISSQRVIFNDGGTLSDFSVELGDYRTGAKTFASTTGDYLYVGSEYPFNHKHFDVSSANAVASTVSVDIWCGTGTGWVAAVDVLDLTRPSTASLAQDGVIRWTTNRLKTWSPQEDSADVTGLAGTAIYNMYWVRLSWSANLTGSTALSYVGLKFATDDDLYTFYPALNNSDLMSQFEAAKADWNEQHYAAAEAIVRDLKRRGVVASHNQIFDYELFTEAACHKACELIYTARNVKAYAEQIKAARDAYEKAIDLKMFRPDANADGHKTPTENLQTTGWLSR